MILKMDPNIYYPRVSEGGAALESLADATAAGR